MNGRQLLSPVINYYWCLLIPPNERNFLQIFIHKILFSNQAAAVCGWNNSLIEILYCWR